MTFPLSDLHIHSLASGHAFNTIDEITAFAAQNGYKLIGISDHGPNMERAPHSGYFEMLYRLPNKVNGMTVLYGCEANILDVSGRLDLNDDLIMSLDYVIAGLHKRTSYSGCSQSENTDAIVSLINSGRADIVSHPISLSFPGDPEKILQAALKNHVILECNKSVLREAVARHKDDIIKLNSVLFEGARDMGVKILLGSDAHHISEMAVSDDEDMMLKEYYHISLSDMLNSYPEKLYNLLMERKRARSETFRVR